MDTTKNMLRIGVIAEIAVALARHEELRRLGPGHFKIGHVELQCGPMGDGLFASSGEGQIGLLHVRDFSLHKFMPPELGGLGKPQSGFHLNERSMMRHALQKLTAGSRPRKKYTRKLRLTMPAA